MSPRKRKPREIKMAQIEAGFRLASYWWGSRWCPAVARKDSGGYAIRVVRSETISGPNRNVTYDYFEIDADAVIATAPRGYAKDYKPGRVVDIEAAAARFATPDSAAPRIQIGGAW